MTRLLVQLLSPILLIFNFSTLHAAETFPVRIGVIAYGTLQWELTVIEQYGLAQSENLQLNLVTLANPQAGKIALQSGTVDIGVADWFWVSNQRSNNKSSLTFAPYSSTAGALMVPGSSSIQTINELAGKRVGIAGGELDKNWLLLQAVASTSGVLNFNSSVNKTYAAPPILNQQLVKGRLDALLTYWHYAARLEAQGYKRILDGAQLLKLLGVKQTLPTLGYIFDDQWANQHRQPLERFLKISLQAKNLICTSDEAWKLVVPLTRSENEHTQAVLRQRYCEGRIQHWGDDEKHAAAKIYDLVASNHPQLFPEQSQKLAAGTFWDFNFSNLTTQTSKLPSSK